MKEFDLEKYYWELSGLYRQKSEIPSVYFDKLSDSQSDKLVYLIEEIQRLEREYDDIIIEPVLQKYKSDNYLKTMFSRLSHYQKPPIIRHSGKGSYYSNRMWPEGSSRESENLYRTSISTRIKKINEILSTLESRVESIREPNFGDIRSFLNSTKPTQKAFCSLLNLLATVASSGKKEEFRIAYDYSESILEKNYKFTQRLWCCKKIDERVIGLCKVLRTDIHYISQLEELPASLQWIKIASEIKASKNSREKNQKTVRLLEEMLSKKECELLKLQVGKSLTRDFKVLSSKFPIEFL